MNLRGKFDLKIKGAFVLFSANLWSNADFTPHNYRAMQTLPRKIMKTFFQGPQKPQKNRFSENFPSSPPSFLIHIIFYISEFPLTLWLSEYVNVLQSVMPCNIIHFLKFSILKQTSPQSFISLPLSDINYIFQVGQIIIFSGISWPFCTS